MHSCCIKYIHIVVLSPLPCPYNSCKTLISKTFINSQNCNFYPLNKNSPSPPPRRLSTIIILSDWMTMTSEVPHTRGITVCVFRYQLLSLSLPVSFLSTVPLWTFLYRIPQRVTIRRNSNTWLTEIKTETHLGVTSRAEIVGKFRIVVQADAFPDMDPGGGPGTSFQQVACGIKG